MKISSKAGVLSLAALILVGASGCGSAADTTPQNQTSETKDTTPQAQKGKWTVFDRKLNIKDGKKFTENNFLATSETSRFSIDAYGILDKVAFDETGSMRPADGEVFHAINYTSDGSSTSKVSFDIDGTTNIVEKPLGASGTLIISAPQDAEITLNLEDLDLTQSIDLKTAKRTTEGLADVWYGKTVGKVADGIVSTSTVVSNHTVKLSYAISSAKRTAYSQNNKWADGGKSAWVVLDGTNPEWDIPNSGYEKDAVHKIVIVDEKGKEYSPEGVEADSYGGKMHLEFKVPADDDTFTVKSDSSTGISYFGEVVATIPSLKTSQAKISFK